MSTNPMAAKIEVLAFELPGVAAAAEPHSSLQNKNAMTSLAEKAAGIQSGVASTNHDCLIASAHVLVVGA